VESSTLRNLTEFAKFLMGFGRHSSIWFCYVLVFDLERLKSRSMSYSVIIFFFNVLFIVFIVACLLLIVLLSLAELFFHSPFELMARNTWETSLVRVVIAALSLFFLRRPMFYLLCINDYYNNTKIYLITTLTRCSILLKVFSLSDKKLVLF